MNKPRYQKILSGLAQSVWALVLACLAPSLVLAAPGDLDTTFGGGAGWVSTPIIKPGNDLARSVIQQADGKLVAAGLSYDGSNEDFALARYNGDSTLDTTFNGTGKLIMAISASMDDGAYSVIQQADGKLVAAGHSYNGSNNDFALMRVNSNGTLDTTFNGTGKLTTAIGASNDYAWSVIQQADGKLVAAGYSYNGSNNDFALVRYNSNGTLDTTFNGTGKLITAIGASNDVAYSVIQQADGKLVAAGYSRNGSGNDDFALVRYNSNGTLDTTFNGTGKLITAIGASQDYAYSLTQQADGKLVVAGWSHNGSNNDFALARYNSDGSLDTTFSGDGKLTMVIGTSDDLVTSVIQQADGKLVVAGYSSSMPTGQEFVVARFESGQPDTDNDGVLDISDAFPNNPAEWLDTDNDGTGNNADFDDDNDNVPDVVDADPLNPAVTSENSLPMNGNYQGSSVDEAMTVQ